MRASPQLVRQRELRKPGMVDRLAWPVAVPVIGLMSIGAWVAVWELAIHLL